MIHLACVDVNDILTNCTSIYFRVNIHYFLDDNCEGDIAIGVEEDPIVSQEDAIQKAENLINEINGFFDIMSQNLDNSNHMWHNDAMGVDPSPAQCLPFRFVLDDVFIHCDTDAQTTNVSFSDFDPFLANDETALNIFISNLPNNRSTGFTFRNGEKMVVETLGSGLSVHEIAHMFGLGHQHDNFDVNGCNDVWQSQYTWDHDCDASTPSQLLIHGCWDHTPSEGCDPEQGCEEHPCCTWGNQHNNISGYSAWAGNPEYASVSACQLEVMVNEILGKCDYIAAIDPACPPPNANITQPAIAQGRTSCPFSFFLSGSVHEVGHSYIILDSNGNEIEASGLIDDTAQDLDIYTLDDGYGGAMWPYGMVAGEQYTLVLSVWSDCGTTNTTKVDFTLPLPQPCGVKEKSRSFLFDYLTPNPANTNQVSLGLDVLNQTYVDIFLTSPLQSSGTVTLYRGQLSTGSQQVALNLAGIDNGVHIITVVMDDQLFSKTIVKL